MATESSPSHSFAGRVVVAVSIAIGLIALAILLWQTAEVLLLTFAGVLLAIFLRTLMSLITSRSKIGDGLALPIVLVLLLALSAAAIVLVAPSVSHQFDEFAQKLPLGVATATHYLEGFPIFRQLVNTHRDPLQMISAGLIARVGGFFASGFGLIGAALVIFFVGLYGAIEPEIYAQGILQLIPRRGHERTREVIHEMGTALRSWLMTRLFAMAVIGILTTVGLLIIGVPLAVAIGIIAALLTFIPYIGPAVSAIPAILIALMQSPAKALWVLVLSLAIHLIEAYFLTPIIQKRAMSLSPILAIVTQVLFGVIWGLLGMALATPITAVAVVLVQMLYVQDTLGEKPDLHGLKSG